MNGWSVRRRPDVRRARILVVDDELPNIRILERVLAQGGFEDVVATTSSTKAVRLFREIAPDLVLLDLKMPVLSGFDVMERLRPYLKGYLPILVLTGDTSSEARRRALTAGAKDFVVKPFDPSEVLARVNNLLETRWLHLELKSQNERLEVMVRERTASLREALTRLEATQVDLRLSRAETIDRLGVAAEFRDIETARHVKRMGRYCALIADRLDHDPARCELLRLASMMHDIGKIGIPDRILLKPGSLTPEERSNMERHTEIGYQILSGSRSDLLGVAATIAWTHHERYDGTGYPRALKGHEIPSEGRIAAVADVFDALTTDRVYRKAMDVPAALSILEDGRGSHFDPIVLDPFLDAADEVAVIREEAPLRAS